MTTSNSGWLKRVMMWDWHDIALRGWPGWDREPGGNEPLRVNLSVVSGTGKSSLLIASEFDHVATGPFYWRDWTDSGIPFVEAGEVYRSAFWFARKADQEVFQRMYCGPLAEEKRAMTKEELKNLKVGDRVRWIGGSDHSDGTVTEKKFGFAHITWDDGAKKMVIGWRSRDDRERGKNIVKVGDVGAELPKETTP